MAVTIKSQREIDLMRKSCRLLAKVHELSLIHNMGCGDVEWLDDNWTVVTEDGSLSAHYENTILITDGEPEILTLL